MRLISTAYAPDSNPAEANYQPSLFESESPAFDATKTHASGTKFVLDREDANRDEIVNIDDLRLEYLDGDGNIRSPKETALRDEADFVINNPPFSQFRQLMTWVVGNGRKFSIIGNNNAITYNEVFPHIMDNRLWGGCHREQHRHGLRRTQGCRSEGSRPSRAGEARLSVG